MRRLPSRFSEWVVVHPVLWGVGLGVVLVLLGSALNLAPIVVIAAGAALGVLNILHAKRRGYCPLPVERGSHPVRAEAEAPFPERSDD
jgi:glucokinase